MHRLHTGPVGLEVVVAEDASERCWGPSEQSGLGLCAPFHSVLETRGRCGGRLGMPCGVGSGCLRFVASWDADYRPEERWGFCAPLDRCCGLAAARPDRFDCLE